MNEKKRGIYCTAKWKKEVAWGGEQEDIEGVMTLKGHRWYRGRTFYMTEVYMYHMIDIGSTCVCMAIEV